MRWPISFKRLSAEFRYDFIVRGEIEKRAVSEPERQADKRIRKKRRRRIIF